MIETIKTPTSKKFFNLLHSAQKELLLCSPFITNDIITEIFKRKNDATKLQIITSANIANFISGALDIKAIKQLMDKNVEVYNYQNLHAKIYLFDCKKAIITSANLTHGGFYKNYEYGIIISENEQNIIDQIYADFINMMDDKDMFGKFKKQDIPTIEKIIDSYKNNRKINITNIGEKILSLDGKTDEIEKNLNGWTKDVFLCIKQIKANEFHLNDVYKFETTLSKKYPKNNNVKPKIRQMLQELRNIGLIRFVKPGYYKKLWN